jgi:hypothetical protein
MDCEDQDILSLSFMNPSYTLQISIKKLQPSKEMTGTYFEGLDYDASKPFTRID